MPKIWTEQGQVKETPNRNNFDLSFQNHLTMKMGGLYPVMCKRVMPGDSFDIEAAFGLKFMPLVFPVQSRMRAHMYFFYVRNKNIWQNWENFAQMLEDHVHPYIDQPSDFFSTGSLADYLNIPTTQTGFPLSLVHSVSDPVRIDNHTFQNGQHWFYDTTSISQIVASDGGISYVEDRVIRSVPIVVWPESGQYQWNELVRDPIIQDIPLGANWYSMFFYTQPFQETPADGHKFVVFGENLDLLPHTSICAIWLNRPGADFYSEGTLNWNRSQFLMDCHFEAVGGQPGRFEVVASSGFSYDGILSVIRDYREQGYQVFLSFLVSGFPPFSDTFEYVDKDVVSVIRFGNAFNYVANIPSVSDHGVKPFGNELVVGKDSQRICLNALPFRAYESIYNAFFRNTQNQPFYIDGVEQFNRYNTTLEDGADSTPYRLFYRNYEMDYLTSCLQSPQQGVAPLVGLTSTGEISIADENGITTGTYEVDQDGTIGQVVVTSPNASAEHGRIAMSLSQAGMSINDFRGTNALQRWLEMNLRRGYKYLDFITGHFGQAPHYDSLDLPQFIGGFSQTVQVNMISSTADTSGSGGMILGDYAGQASCFGGSRYQIRQYCDDFGYIMGILCVVPTPAYTQILDKDWLTSKPLDYPFPEFMHLGLQPITYREVCPIQSYQEYVLTEGASGNNQDTFGYQRPNYDLVGSVDQVHGQFRASMRNYLVNRIFAERPYLGSQFLEINPSEVNDIFVLNDPNEDSIIGQVVFDIKAKRPVPRVVVPNLGR